MKGSTSAMLGHLIFGFLAGAFGILTTIQGSGEGLVNPSILPTIILLPLLGLSGVMIFLGGVGFIVKKRVLYYVGLFGDILMILIALTGMALPLIILGAILAFTIYPEVKGPSADKE